MSNNKLVADILIVKGNLPEQGPLDYFVHHNTLHNFEDHNFFEAVKLGANLYDNYAFLPEAKYQECYLSGRISQKALKVACSTFIKAKKLSIKTSTLAELLLLPKHKSKFKDLNFIQESQAKYFSYKKAFYAEELQNHYGYDLPAVYSETIYKFFCAYFDFGFATWEMPDRAEGLWSCYARIYSAKLPFQSKFQKTLSDSIVAVENSSPLAVIESTLVNLKILPDDQEDYLFNLAYRFKGWSALTKSLEIHPEWNHKDCIQANFSEFLAILVISEYAAIKCSEGQEIKVPTEHKIPHHSVNFLNSYSHFLKNNSNKTELMEILPLLTDFRRQELWHHAYEEDLYTQFLNAYAVVNSTDNEANKPTYQTFFCIDDREESFRRHFERILPQNETFGIAGHFGLDIKFKGLNHQHFRSLCPVGVTPKYEIYEQALNENSLRLNLLHFWGRLERSFFENSRTFIRSTLQIIFLGWINAFSSIISVLFPGFAIKIRDTKNKLYAPVDNKLVFQAEIESNCIKLEDRLQIAKNFINISGLNNNFANYVIFIGHGSSSLNNPHEAAHDCGACGGGRGKVNARLLALILNEKKVRTLLAEENIVIPPTTTFVGAYHNTCNNKIDFYDLPKYPDQELTEYIKGIELAALTDSRERFRRFAVKKGLDENYYHRHAQSRAVNIAQPRPEYGHATNAFCVVGPRSKTKKLFLDRRSFLVSYNNKLDPDLSKLKATLNAVGPVCAGINLEYYFSSIDNENYGCGTKLPHNVTSLAGVMNGYLSDLQIGLPLQMIEIHEPVRLMMLVCCSLEQITSILSEDCPFSRLVKKQWIELTINHDNQLYRFTNQQFVEFTESSKVPEYQQNNLEIFNSNEHLPFGVLV